MAIALNGTANALIMTSHAGTENNASSPAAPTIITIPITTDAPTTSANTLCPIRRDTDDSRINAVPNPKSDTATTRFVSAMMTADHPISEGASQNGRRHIVTKRSPIANTRAPMLVASALTIVVK